MLMVKTVVGNIHRDLGKEYEEMSHRGAVEKISISRMESERVRMRKATDKGTDVALTLAPGSRLQHGDVLAKGERMIVVEIEPEKVAVVRLEDARTAILVGHAIGNLHRPIKIQGDNVYFPIQSDDEISLIQKQLAHVPGLKISSQTIVFEPEVAVHGH